WWLLVFLWNTGAESHRKIPMLTAPTSTAHPVHPVPNRQRGNPIPTTGHQGTIHLKPTDKTPVMYHEQLAYRRVSPRLIPLRQITNAIGFACFFLFTFFPLVILRLLFQSFLVTVSPTWSLSCR